MRRQVFGKGYAPSLAIRDLSYECEKLERQEPEAVRALEKANTRGTVKLRVMFVQTIANPRGDWIAEAEWHVPT